MHLLIIGGSDAGISAALRAQELDPGVEVSMALADDFPNFSICGLPYFLSGETPDWRDLAHRTEFPGLNILRQHKAGSIDVAAKSVAIRNAGKTKTLRYDRLIVATGAAPVCPNLPGSALEGVYLLHTMDDSFAVHRHLNERQPESAILVGAGYIGLEMVDALRQRGLDVTLLSRAATVLPTVDPALGRMVGEELQRNGVHVLTSVSATEVMQVADGPRRPRLAVVDSAGGRHTADLVIFAIGVRPNSDLAHAAGAALGANNAIAVTRQMRTSLPDVFAAGDCVETYHRLLKRQTYISLGTIAHKQGRVAGENAIGGDRQFAGAVGTQSLKVFDLAIARTGLLDHEARAGGFNPLTVPTTANDHKAYYPGSTPLNVLISGDRSTGRLLGAQILGSRKAEISKRIDIVAAALFQNAAVEELNDMDLSYTPPFSSPWDPVQMAAQAWASEARKAAGFDHAVAEETA
ncbi:MAG: FAD-dependent oxidoreductase [Beijerinckiaceae bacterium]